MLLLRIAVVRFCETGVIMVKTQPFLKELSMDFRGGFVLEPEGLGIVIGLGQDIITPPKESSSHFVDQAFEVQAFQLN